MENFKTIYDFLEERKNDTEIVFEIVDDQPTNTPKKTRKEELHSIIKSIGKLKISKEQKEFLLEQFSISDNNSFLKKYLMKNGEYSFKDLYELTNLYIEYLKKENNPFDTFYPIVIGNKTYLNNIALFIACLKLNLNPVLIDLKEIDISKIKNCNKSDEHNFYVASSGTTSNGVLKELNEKKFLDLSLVSDLLRKFEKGKTFYNNSPICNISGLEPILIFSLFAGLKIMISNESNLIYDLEHRNINYSFLPITNINKTASYILDDNLLNKSFEYFLVSGDEINIKALNYYLENNSHNVSLSNFIYLYGQTETYGYASGIRLDQMKTIELDADYILRQIGLNVDVRMIEEAGKNYQSSITNIFDEFSNDNYKYKVLNYHRTSLEDKIPSSCDGYGDEYYDDVDPSNKYIFSYYTNGKILFNQIGKKSKLFYLSSYPLGEIIANGIHTGDLGYCIEDEIYFICRKNFPEKVLLKLIESKTNTECSFAKKDGKSILAVNTRYHEYIEMMVVERLFLDFIKESGISKCKDNISFVPYFANIFMDEISATNGVGKKILSEFQYPYDEKNDLYRILTYPYIYCMYLMDIFEAKNSDELEKKMIIEYNNYVNGLYRQLKEYAVDGKIDYTIVRDTMSQFADNYHRKFIIPFNKLIKIDKNKTMFIDIIDQIRKQTDLKNEYSLEIIKEKCRDYNQVFRILKFYNETFCNGYLEGINNRIFDELSNGCKNRLKRG